MWTHELDLPVVDGSVKTDLKRKFLLKLPLIVVHGDPPKFVVLNVYQFRDAVLSDRS